MAEARRLFGGRAFEEAFRHLERAHVLGQQFVLPHVRTHWGMLKIGVFRHSPSEIWGRAVRIGLGALGSCMGRVPAGNTGGTNISMFQRLPIQPELLEILRRAA